MNKNVKKLNSFECVKCAMLAFFSCHPCGLLFWQFWSVIHIHIWHSFILIAVVAALFSSFVHCMVYVHELGKYVCECSLLLIVRKYVTFRTFTYIHRMPSYAVVQLNNGRLMAGWLWIQQAPAQFCTGRQSFGPSCASWSRMAIRSTRRRGSTRTYQLWCAIYQHSGTLCASLDKWVMN